MFELPPGFLRGLIIEDAPTNSTGAQSKSPRTPTLPDPAPVPALRRPRGRPRKLDPWLTAPLHRYERGEHFGHLTLIEPIRDPTRSIFNNYWSRGWWSAECMCGQIVKTHTSDLRTQTQRGFSCGCIPRPRKLSDRVYEHAANLEGQTFGRLFVVEWKDRCGWECVCLECGEFEVVIRSSLLGPTGARPCRNSVLSRAIDSAPPLPIPNRSAKI